MNADGDGAVRLGGAVIQGLQRYFLFDKDGAVRVFKEHLVSCLVDNDLPEQLPFWGQEVAAA